MPKADREFRFDRMELAGSLGDLGTLLPLATGMILLNGMHAANVLMAAGLFYLAAGLYFRVPVPVQPMKAIAAYAIATGMSAQQILASGLWMGVFLLFLGMTNAIEIIRRYTPKSTIRGLQLAVGVVLLTRGLELIVAEDPQLAVETVGPINTGILLGVAGLALTLLLLNSEKIPAALALLFFGILAGVVLGKPPNQDAFLWGLTFPKIVPYGWPSWNDLMWVLPVLVLPQLPVTIGNAIISSADLSHQYFGAKARRITTRSLSVSQGLANLGAFLLGGIPLCHGAGGLAAHFRFGARTAGSNVLVGGILVLLALVFGESVVSILRLLPLSVLGVLLAFAGIQLALTIEDVDNRKELFVGLLMVGLALAFNLGVAFFLGIAVAYLLQSERMNV